MKGKVALVTGAGTKPPGIGIGCAISQVLAGQGAAGGIVEKGAANAEDKLKVSETDERVGAVTVADVSVESDCESMVQAATETFGGLDILVNNAGISKHVPVTSTTFELFEE